MQAALELDPGQDFPGVAPVRAGEAAVCVNVAMAVKRLFAAIGNDR